MIDFGSHKRDLQRPIRGNTNAASFVPRFLRIDRNLREFPFVKTRRVQGANRFTSKRRPKFLFWVVELLLAVGFNVAKRYVKSWTASLAKEESPVRRRVSEPRISGEPKSETIIDPAQRGQQLGEGQTQTRTSSAARVLDLLKSTAMEWSRDKCPQLGAALAYYRIF
jgi:hypothetical protein